MERKAIILLITTLLSLTTLPAFAAQSTPTHLVMYQQYSSRLTVNPMETIYEYSYSAYNTTGSQTTVTATRYVYTVSVGEVKTYSGTITVQVSPFGVTVDSQIPQLARVLLVEPGLIEEVVWAGFLNSSGTVSGLAYFNSSAELVLQFLNGTSFANVTFTINHNTSTYSKSVALALREVSLTLLGQSSFTSTVTSSFPQRYHEMAFDDFGVAVRAPYNTTVAYFNGTYLPAMAWIGFGMGNVLVPNFRFTGSYMFTAIELFGVNGTPVAFIENHFASTFHAHSFFGNHVDYVGSSLKVVINEGAEYVHPNAMVVMDFRGNPVVVGVSDSGVESTAEVGFYHKVAHAALVYLNVNNGGGFFLVFPNSSYVEVNAVTPSEVRVTNVTIAGKPYVAQEVVVNGSGYIMFNVTVLRNETFAVFKQTSNGLVQVNPKDYFVYQGKVVVVDDPSSTYYVVYGYSPSSQTSGIGLSNLEITVVGVVVLMALVAGLVLARRR